MRLLANENIPAALIRSLRAAGHDVVWVRETAPGITDPQVIAQAIADERVLVTFDKDFGELAFARSLPATCGVILLRLPMDDLTLLIAKVVTLIGSRDDWPGQFAVVEEARVRFRPLPPVE